jgi:hypothetical protein
VGVHTNDHNDRRSNLYLYTAVLQEPEYSSISHAGMMLLQAPLFHKETPVMELR